MRRAFWRSLQLRVVTSTMVVSMAVVAVLGVFLDQQINTSVLNARLRAATSEAQADRIAVLGFLSQPDGEAAKQSGDSGKSLQNGGDSPLSQATTALANRAGSASRYSVIICNRRLPGACFGTTNVDERSVTEKMRADVVKQDAGKNSLWYGDLYYKDSSEPVPGLVLGARLDTTGAPRSTATTRSTT
nr:hypothetical protein GCM10020093_093170 [Planobispora longispora]